MARCEADLVPDEVDVQIKSTVSFGNTSIVSWPTIKELARVVGAIAAVSPKYRLIKVSSTV